ncbi:MAG: FTR1 family protein [bacterium]|nr:FTR1 family protein [bacterium]
MLTTAIIAFREFLEAFLIVGVFLGISKTLNLKKGKEITLAAVIGIMLSLLLATLTYAFGESARGILNEENAEFLEGYLMIFSGIFIAYVVFSLHSFMNRARGQKMLSAQKQLQKKSFDLSLFFTIIFLVFREGFEIALFTASVSLFSAFLQNFFGLLVGFASASAIGIATFFAYIRFPIGKIFKATEYAIVLLGAGLAQRGITKLMDLHFHIKISDILSLPLSFLPDRETFFGHMLRGLFGIDSELSVVRVGIMLAYIGVLYIIFKQRRLILIAYKKAISLF